MCVWGEGERERNNREHSRSELHQIIIDSWNTVVGEDTEHKFFE